MYLPLYMNHVHEVTAQAMRRMGSPELELKAVCESPDGEPNPRPLEQQQGLLTAEPFLYFQLLGTRKEPTTSCPLISKCVS